MIMRTTALVLLLLVCACSSRPYAIEASIDMDAPKNNRIYIASHGWHTGFIVPAIQTEQYLPHLKDRFDNASYYEIGWGDAEFYQAKEITTGITMQAILWPTDTVVHVVKIPNNPLEYFKASEVSIIMLSNEQLDNLLLYIKQSFYYNETEKSVLMKQGIYGDSQFYKGEGTFHLFNTCNKWTAKGLKSVGLDIWPGFKLTAGSIMSYLEDYQPVAK